MVADVLDPDARLLHDLPGHRFFYGLSLVHEPRQRREAVTPECGPVPGLAQQAPLSVVDHHDDHRVGAGEVLGVAGGTSPHTPAPGDEGLLATHRAEAVSAVPRHLGPGLGNQPRFQRAQVLPGRPGILKLPLPAVAKLAYYGILSCHIDHEMGPVSVGAQEEAVRIDPQPGLFVGGEPPKDWDLTLGDEDVQVGNGQESALRVLLLVLDPLFIPAFPLTPVQGIAGEPVGHPAERPAYIPVGRPFQDAYLLCCRAVKQQGRIGPCPCCRSTRPVLAC